MGLRKELWNDLDRGLQYLEPAFIRASRLRVIFLCELLPSDLLINPKGHLKHPKQATREKLDYKLFRAPSCIENPPGHWTRKSSAVGVVGRVKPPGPGRAPEKSTWWVSSWQLRLNLEATKTHLWLTCRVWINYTLFNPVKANALQVWMWPLISAISKAHGLHWTETILKQHCFQYGKLITPSYAWSKFTLVPLHLSMPAGCLSTCLSFYLHVLFYNYMGRLSWKAHIVSLNQYCLPGISYVENAHFFKPEDSRSSHFGWPMCGQIKWWNASCTTWPTLGAHGFPKTWSPPAWTLHFRFCAAMFFKKHASSPCLSNKERFPESFSAKTRRKNMANTQHRHHSRHHAILTPRSGL